MKKKYKISSIIGCLLAPVMLLRLSVTVLADEYQIYADDNGYYEDYTYDDYTYDDYTYDDNTYDDYTYDDYTYDDYSGDDYSTDDYSDNNASDSSQDDEEEDEHANDPVVLAETPVPEYTPNPNITVPYQGESHYVLDNASVLDEDTEREIDELGSELYKETGAQVVLVTISTTKYNLRDYAYTLFNEWKIGGDGKHGLLFLLDIEDDLYYSFSGEGLKAEINSADLRQINRTYLEPYFANKDYNNAALAVYKGGVSMVKSAMELIGPVGTPDPSMLATPEPEIVLSTQSGADKIKERAVGIFSIVLKVLGIILAAAAVIAVIFFAVVYLHGRSVKKKRAEAKKRKSKKSKASVNSHSRRKKR